MGGEGFAGVGFVDVTAAGAFDDHESALFAMAMDACLANGAEGGAGAGAGGNKFLLLLRGPSPETPPLGIRVACDLDFSAAVGAGEDEEITPRGGIKMTADRATVMGATGEDPRPKSIDQIVPVCRGEGGHEVTP